MSKASLSERVRERRWTAEVAERVLSAHRASGASLARFAREQGLPVQRLHWWRKRLAEWEGPASGEAALAPVVIRDSGRAAVKLQVGEVTVEVSDAGAVPASWVSELVHALRGGR